MKKIILSIAMIATIAFTGCSDNDETDKKCLSCEFSGLGVETPIKTQYCDNGDGTMTITVKGIQTVTDDIPEGSSFEEIIEAAKKQGTTCND